MRERVRERVWAAQRGPAACTRRRRPFTVHRCATACVRQCVRQCVRGERCGSGAVQCARCGERCSGAVQCIGGGERYR
eukprot:5458761-Prymnesium_polylepis.1